MPKPLFSKSRARRNPAFGTAAPANTKPFNPRAKPHAKKATSPKLAGGGDAKLLYGLHAVAAAWANPDRVCRRLLVTEGGAAALKPALETARQAGLKRPSPQIVERADLDRLLPGAVHQGIVLDVEPLEETTLDDLLAATFDRPATLLVLDQVTDPHNVGAIVRSASAFGAVAVIAPRHNAAEITGTLAKSASGAVEHIAYVRVANLARALETIMDAGFTTIALDERADKTIAELAPFHRTALIMGAEGEGLRRLTLEASQYKAKLPTGGPIGSLNVSNAAAGALYELARAAIKTS